MPGPGRVVLPASGVRFMPPVDRVVVLPVAGLFLVGLAPLVAPAVEAGIPRPVPPAHHPGWGLVLVVAIQVLPLLMARRTPVVAALVSAAGLTASVLTGQPGTAADFALPIAVYLALRYGAARAAAFIGDHQWHSPAESRAASVVDGPADGVAGTSPAASASAAVAVVAPADMPPEVRRAVETLSPRERQVLGCLVRARTNAEIAGELGISVETVKSHVSRVIRKLAVRDRTAAAVVGQRADVR